MLKQVLKGSVSRYISIKKMVVMSCVTITISLPQSKILSPVERNKNPRELMMQSTPGIMNTDL